MEGDRADGNKGKTRCRRRDAREKLGQPVLPKVDGAATSFGLLILIVVSDGDGMAEPVKRRSGSASEAVT